MTNQAVPARPEPIMEPEAPRRKGQVRWYEVIGGLSAAAGLCVFLLRWGIEGAIHNRPVQVVPDLRGKSVPAALDLLSPLNLAVRKEGTEFNDSVPPGAVLRQNPPAGTKVREGKVVRVVVSQGGQTVFVPSITGLPLRNAEMMLRQSQLSLAPVTESYSLRMEKGMVLSQDPKAESSVQRAALVNVVISGGPPPAGISLMPDFLRKDVSEANSWASANGIKAAVEKDMNALFPAGVIISQEPPADSVLSPETQVKLVISGKVQPVGSQGGRRNVHYEVPQGSSDSHVRIVLVDPYGEREIFNGLRPPGSKVDVDIPDLASGAARLKVFLNGILVEEKDL